MRLPVRPRPPVLESSSPPSVADRAEVLVARQPIVDGDLKLHGYELLFRGARGDVADPQRWTASLIVDGVAELGLDALVGGALAYVNVSRGFLANVDPLPFEPAGVVLELTEDSHHTDDMLLRRLDVLRERGYRIALDDFVYDSSLRPLIERADLIKLDVMADGPQRLAEVIPLLRGYNVRLLAEKVETSNEFDFCRELGCTLFQGYFFARPREITGARVSADKVAGLNTLAELNDPQLTLEDLERIVSADVGLAYKLLRYVNSGFFSLARRIETVHDALVILGRNNVRQWAIVMVLAGATSRPSALISFALLRARLCQKVAAGRTGTSEDAAFMAGLFSVLDALLDLPMDDAVARLPLSEELNMALLGREGDLGEILDEVIAIEEGSLGVLTDIGGAAYAEASAWADAATRLVA